METYTNIWLDISEEQWKKIISTSSTRAEAARKVNRCPNSSFNERLKKYCDEHDISIEHFTINENGNKEKYQLEEILVENSPASRKTLRDYFLSEITKIFPDVKINGSILKRLPGNANISFRNKDRQKILDRLNAAGICASAGSACSAGILKQSHVLNAIGMPKDYSGNSLRITIGKNNTKDEVDYLIKTLSEIVISS